MREQVEKVVTGGLRINEKKNQTGCSFYAS